VRHSAPSDPSRLQPRVALRCARVRDLATARPTLKHVRDLWTLYWSQSNCTAAIWRNDFGLEPRVLHGDELAESRSSRFGDAPLLLIADEVKANLIAQGWFEPSNATADA
jgi:hypothetical protein